MKVNEMLTVYSFRELKSTVYWTVAVLSSVDASLAVDSLSLTDVEWPTNRQSKYYS